MKCLSCGGRIDETAFGLNRKLIGKNVCSFYCVKCLAEKLGCKESDLYGMAERLRRTGCRFFTQKK